MTDTLPVTDNSDGTYEVTVPAKSDLAMLRGTLTFDTGTVFDQGWVEIVGNVLFTEAQARSYNEAFLTSTTVYTDAAIAAERARITDWLEGQTGRSWVPRYRRLYLDGNGAQRLPLWDVRRSLGASGGEGARRDMIKVLAATINGTAVSTSNIEADGSYLWLTSGIWTRPTRGANVIVDVEYGLEYLSAGVDEIGLMELVERLPSNRLDPGATGASDEFGTYSWQPQNNGRPSRIPAVNAWCRDADVRVALA